MATHGEIRWPSVGSFDGRLRGDSHGRRQGPPASGRGVRRAKPSPKGATDPWRPEPPAGRAYSQFDGPSGRKVPGGASTNCVKGEGCQQRAFQLPRQLDCWA
jgi:hypothetical protein